MSTLRQLALFCLLLLVEAPATAAGFRVLVFTRTEGFRHASIPDGVALVQALGAANGFDVDLTEDPTTFAAANLDRYRTVVWLNTTGDVLDPPEEAALEAWARGGGGWVGVHSAADTEYGWPFYGELLGGNAWFAVHPSIQTATVEVEDAGHPSTSPLPASFPFTDEWYNFQNNPRPAVGVLLVVDEASYDPGPGAMGEDHPIAWRHRVGAGRSWYTNLGHRRETYADPKFVSHLLGGILWAAGEPVFLDGFESGDLSGWSRAVPEAERSFGCRSPTVVSSVPDRGSLYSTVAENPTARPRQAAQSSCAGISKSSTRSSPSSTRTRSSRRPPYPMGPRSSMIVPTTS